ncbi:hypothetical protein A3A93_00890 [Candidatus Roizmanbacteria bacterium RIFCSPLOWO2_01_FULL_38_12]|uniref:Uncharacterized protein n=1 Tax=Candidatus Roizmanbacteria bacterium RIFCSPLOWO2_01_FULL_38_12 TaxID=1802061 RepID=A0A1F7IR71_9BACT|nr:MAG: hypothetical protein A3F59_05470 [Candidatus Roizmanbacteria bacterium RIFCSPHIGHO2_12_FULL_38_13]OGK45842.1 MAG: hypothetical protein A3A93_00890 [Candidatus Roizmanbacteria bacterium RIFCSPLOWO2_01_FULL_38_12]
MTVQNIYAVIIPPFPSCINPTGELIAQFSDGIHGIPGDSNTYTGLDEVYKLTDFTVLQCLCPADGQGIQTNWWRVKELTEEEITTLRRSGWTFISDGSAWGLDNAPYVAKNLNYVCIGGVGGKGGGNGSVLGLASTGNIKKIFILSISSIFLILAGLYLKKTYVNQNI